MQAAIQNFIEAHDYCRVLEQFLHQVVGDFERAALRDELRKAYEDLDRRTQVVVGAGFAERGGITTAN